MGLDMYLIKIPRYKNATAKDIVVIEDYYGWKRNQQEKNSKYKNCTLKKWCGVDYKDINKDFLKYYKQFYHETFSAWDDEHKYPWYKITEEIGYWRKVNAVHNWFVERVQDGVDDCEYHKEVKKEDLEELLDICSEVIEKSVLAVGTVANGYTFDREGNKVPITEPGKVVINPEIAKSLLPCSSGFFFGSYDYDEWYINGLIKTVEILNKALKTTDFDKEAIYYISSW